MRAADHIGTVRALGPRSPASGRRVRHALGRARLHPAALSPAAVLAVRRLADPLPGALGSGHGLPPRWEHAARAALDDLRRRAARPRGGRVPEGAAAVLFADEAEWRACAALALARGARPWWADTLAARSVAPLLADAPRLLPAVLDHLATWGEVAPVLAAVSVPEADALLALACEAAGVGGPRPSSLAPPRGPVHADLPWTASEPIARAVAEASVRVGRAQAALLGVAVMLARTPHRLRTPEAVAAVIRWRSAADERPPTARPDEPSPRTDAPSEAAPPDAPCLRAAAPPGPPPAASPTLPTDAPPLPEAVPSTPSTSGATSVAEPAPLPPEADPWPDGTATRLGGAFFLLPVMRAFGWPEVEEPTWRLASTTGTWGVLDALARALLRSAHADDPLWRLLAALDGRAPDEPPRDAVAPEAADLSASGLGLPPALAAWTRSVLPAVEGRLVDALGFDGPGAIPEAVLLREATVTATRSHVDVVFPLASAGLAVRRAGLDADPGWVASAGRVVLFHYR